MKARSAFYCVGVLVLGLSGAAHAQSVHNRQMVLSAVATFIDSVAVVDSRFKWPNTRVLRVSSELCTEGGLPRECALGGWRGESAEAEWAPHVAAAIVARVPQPGIEWRAGQSTRYTASFPSSDARCAAKELITIVTPVDTDREEIRVPIRLSVQPGNSQCTLLPKWGDGVLAFVKSADGLRLKSFSGFRHTGS